MKEKKGRRKDAIERFIESNQTVVLSSLNQLRYTILCEGLPRDKGLCQYRTYVWSILLRVEPLDVDYYANLVDRGPSNVFAKIQNDAFRTFQKDEEFSRKVSTSVLMRILNSHALEIESFELHNSTGAPASPYVQGMNVLAAPFAYVCRSEVEAFALYSQLATRYIPTYTTPNLLGVLNGVKLRMHAAAGPGARALGFSLQLRRASEYILCGGPDDSDKRRAAQVGQSNAAVKRAAATGRAPDYQAVAHFCEADPRPAV
ncbi:hypothetical protein KL933_002815 [Ogataea haglerorum]|uniref:Rab-GAP TBC domain-containing protein n=1 Tax=Ogataea haglerorum TaxID=1937702 RepID=A0AAN6D520_9ASCO|nr:uncharacterized protein KL911_000951 [Ogataea haglerorum]KAG7717812.1 hypothetical protein KL913_002748 [Ogataea haglerorum]KAG7718114.1 hypothetical protein KL949_003086 [Ogataea haglerorum]KAG7727106.1 hypothetical protein KL933_002815 [Ogataea haglerorum]KAG7757975.1 hypothetical protein KL911_000951 [Ogataea haglerorum]KAG7760866.1 hypothetical protein KL947_000837 [Ogataea haglerorum]